MDIGQALVHPPLIDIGDHDRDLQHSGEEQSELSCHEPGTNDTDLGDRAGEFAVGCACRAFGALLHQI